MIEGEGVWVVPNPKTARRWRGFIFVVNRRNSDIGLRASAASRGALWIVREHLGVRRLDAALDSGTVS